MAAAAARARGGAAGGGGAAGAGARRTVRWLTVVLVVAFGACLCSCSSASSAALFLAPRSPHRTQAHGHASHMHVLQRVRGERCDRSRIHRPQSTTEDSSEPEDLSALLKELAQREKALGGGNGSEAADEMGSSDGLDNILNDPVKAAELRKQIQRRAAALKQTGTWDVEPNSENPDPLAKVPLPLALLAEIKNLKWPTPGVVLREGVLTAIVCVISFGVIFGMDTVLEYWMKFLITIKESR